MPNWEPRYYFVASDLFQALRNIREVKDIIGAVNNFSKHAEGIGPINPCGAVDALKDAKSHMKKYNQNDLQTLIEAGFRGISDSLYENYIFPERYFNGLTSHLLHPSAKSKAFFKDSFYSDYLKMSSRYLSAYGSIAEHERELFDEQKREALKAVLSRK